MLNLNNNYLFLSRKINNYKEILFFRMIKYTLLFFMELLMELCTWKLNTSQAVK